MRIVRFSGILSCLLAAACSGGGGDDDDVGPPVVSSVSPTNGIVGATVTISGSGFGATQGTGAVLFESMPATITSWSDDTIVAAVPDVMPATYDVVVSAAGGASGATPFTVLLPPAVYVTDDISSVYGFLLQGGGTLTALAGSPYDSGAASGNFGGDGESVRVHKQTRRVYVTNNRSLAAFDIDPRTAALTPVSGSPFAVTTSGLLFGIAVNDAGNRAFLPDYAAAVVHVLAVGSAGAAAIAGSPFAGGDLLDIPKLSTDGAYLYVNDESGDPSSVHAFSVGATGALTPVAGTPFDYPVAGSNSYGLEMSPQNRLYVPDFGTPQTIRVYDLAGNGVPTENTALRTAQVDPSGLAFTRDGSRLFAVQDNSTGNIHVYDVTTATGALTEVVGSPFLASMADFAPLATDDTGSFLFAVDELAAELQVFAVSSAGALTPVGSPYALSGEPSGIDFTR